MFDIDNTQAQSVTATVCENAQLYGATPERDEFDPREVWDADDTMDAVSEAFRIIAQGVGPDGTQLADERESLLWGFVNTFDAQVRRLDRSVDRLSPELRDLQREQDGTEIKSRELELVTDRAQNFGDRRDAFEKMRDAAADAYRAETGDTWRPRRGSNVSQTGKLTSAAIDARDFMRARKDRQMKAHLPEGTLVAIAGGKTVSDPGAVFDRLDKAKAKYDDIILAHGGGPGVERIAAQWAERNGVHQVVCKPDWNAHGRAAPFRRNDELLNLLPKGVIAFPGSGITDNLVDKAVKARHPGPARRRLSPHRHHGPRRFGGVALFLWSDTDRRHQPHGPPSLRASPAAPRSAAAPPLFLRTTARSLPSHRRHTARLIHIRHRASSRVHRPAALDDDVRRASATMLTIADADG